MSRNTPYFVFPVSRIALIGLALLHCQVPFAAQTCNGAIRASTPDSDFTVHEDGTATHHKTGLMWLRDPLPGTHTWEQALAQAQTASYAGYSDWRLPNIKELASIVETHCYDPAINLNIFPASPSLEFWSSSQFTYASYAWWVDFSRGGAGYDYRSDARYVRIVRGGQ